MARKVDKAGTKPKVSPRPATDVEDLAILHPDREVTIAGRPLVIREYGFVEGLKMRAIAQPFIDALYALTDGSGGRPPSFLDVEALLGEHFEHVIPLIAKAADIESEWISSLSDEDGYRLMQEWWLATSGFFIRRVVERLATERAVERLAGLRSTTFSSAPDMAAHPPTSDASPTAS